MDGPSEGESADEYDEWENEHSLLFQGIPPQGTRVASKRLPDYLECGICKEAFYDPQQFRDTGCAHTFCKACALQWLKAKKDPNDRRCPICQAEVRSKKKGAPLDELLVSNTTAAKALEAEHLRYCCRFGLEEQGGHFERVSGPDFCPRALRPGKITEHEAACPFVPAWCAHCGDKHRKSGMARHLVEAHLPDDVCGSLKGHLLEAIADAERAGEERRAE
eukprot:CAMPEP_0182895528 /NCGR_PEP_ID=MMETSP0034_2-20130328/25739_1 /TAXON_ID=156128 /ORGANISM="Nephroselmis pyriformis, Strain CCMP717" /LENGTH=219 /DNA_ID=CAMNT_0025029363 /DNA_START=1 /DNA_END=657 /DNA_ORIENTATION=+